MTNFHAQSVHAMMGSSILNVMESKTGQVLLIFYNFDNYKYCNL